MPVPVPRIGGSEIPYANGIAVSADGLEFYVASSGQFTVTAFSNTSPEAFSLEEFAACPRPFIVEALDPQTLEIEDIATGPANPDFSNITMAIEIGGELWIGTFAGDRIAYRVAQ